MSKLQRKCHTSTTTPQVSSSLCHYHYSALETSHWFVSLPELCAIIISLYFLSFQFGTYSLILNIMQTIILWKNLHNKFILLESKVGWTRVSHLTISSPLKTYFPTLVFTLLLTFFNLFLCPTICSLIWFWHSDQTLLGLMYCVVTLKVFFFWWNGHFKSYF